MAVLAVAHRPVEADRIAAHGQHAAGLVDAGLGGVGDFFDRRLAAQLLQQLARDVPHLRHRFHHVDRDADRAALVGHGPGDRLANPPGGVGAELEAAAILELVDRPHQAGVALLDQVQEAQAAVAVLLGDRDHQPQVAFRQAALGLLVLGVDLLEVGHPVPQAGGRFLRGAQDVAELGEPGLALLRPRGPCSRRWPSMRALSSSTRRLNSSSVLIIGSIRCVRRPSSSIRRTARRRRRPSRRQAARRWPRRRDLLVARL